MKTRLTYFYFEYQVEIGFGFEFELTDLHTISKFTFGVNCIPKSRKEGIAAAKGLSRISSLASSIILLILEK